MKKIFLSLMALTMCVMSYAEGGSVLGKAEEGSEYWGNGDPYYKCYGLEDGSVALYAIYLSAATTEIAIPAYIYTSTTDENGDYLYYEVSQVGYSNWGVIWVDLEGINQLTNLTSVTISEGIKKVNTSAFYGASALQYLTLPASLTEIGGYAFQNCYALEGIWYNALTTPIASVGESAFSGTGDAWDSIYNNCFVYILKSDVKEAFNTGNYDAWDYFYDYGHVKFHTFELYDNYYEDKSFYNNKYVNVKTNRTFTAGHWHTICFPFSIDNWNLKNVFGDAVELAYLSTSNLVGEDLYLHFGTDVNYTDACKPYLIKPSKDVAEYAEFSGVWFSTEANSKTAHTNNANFIGSFEQKVLTADQYFMGNDDNLYTNAGVIMGGYRAYFEFGASVPAGVRAHITINGKVTTDVENVQSDDVQCTKVIENGQLYMMYKGTKYNIQGQIIK